MNARILLSFAALVVVSAMAVRGQEAIGFKPVPAHEIEIGAFTDSDVDALIATLDSLLAREKDPAKWAKSAEIHFWRFSTRLNHGRLNAAQESRIRGYFNELAAKHPADAAAVTKERDAILPRLIGKVAPDIAGKDLDGVEFKLSDYRGKVVVLVFSGDWC